MGRDSVHSKSSNKGSNLVPRHSSSISLLQERFRQLHRMKQMRRHLGREELQAMFSALHASNSFQLHSHSINQQQHSLSTSLSVGLQCDDRSTVNHMHHTPKVSEFDCDSNKMEEVDTTLRL